MVSDKMATRIIVSGIILGLLYLGNAMCVSFVEGQSIVRPIGR